MQCEKKKKIQVLGLKEKEGHFFVSVRQCLSAIVINYNIIDAIRYEIMFQHVYYLLSSKQ